MRGVMACRIICLRQNSIEGAIRTHMHESSVGQDNHLYRGLIEHYAAFLMLIPNYLFLLGSYTLFDAMLFALRLAVAPA